MKKIIYNGLSLLTISILTYSCTPKASKAVNSAGGNEATAVYNKFVKEYNTQAIAEGKTIMENNCGKCHGLKPADKHSLEKWDRILDRMIPKAKLSTEDGNKVRAYIYSVNLNK